MGAQLPRARRAARARGADAPGRAAVEAAKATGAWDATDDVDDLLVPEDLRTALAERPPATEAFEGFPPSVRRSILRWIAAARTPATRGRRVLRTATDAQQGVRTPSHG